MAQAESVSITTRRSFLAAAAVAGAIGVPNIASAKATADAELIDLGKKLSKLTQEYYVECARLRPYLDEYRRRMDAWDESHPDCEEGEALAEYARVRAEIGLDVQEGLNHPDDVMERIGPIADAINAIPATSWMGVVIKAQLAKFGADTFWESSEADCDWDKLLMRKLCDAVVDMAARTAAQVAAS